MKNDKNKSEYQIFDENHFVKDIGKNNVCISNIKDNNKYFNIYDTVKSPNISDSTTEIHYNTRLYYFNNTTNVLIEEEYISE